VNDSQRTGYYPVRLRLWSGHHNQREEIEKQKKDFRQQTMLYKVQQ
jgi:hypothetical protein